MSLTPKKPKTRKLTKKQQRDLKFDYSPLKPITLPYGGTRSGWRTSTKPGHGRYLGSVKDTNPNLIDNGSAIDKYYIAENGQFVRVRYVILGGKPQPYMIRYEPEIHVPEVIKQGIKDRKIVEV